MKLHDLGVEIHLVKEHGRGPDSIGRPQRNLRDSAPRLILPSTSRSGTSGHCVMRPPLSQAGAALLAPHVDH